MNKKQNIFGIIVAIAAVVLGCIFLKTETLFFRLLVGMGLGYALTRGFMGFAGSVNRAYRGGSTKLMQILMFLFVITAIVNAGFLFTSDPKGYDLWINPINFGLILGGISFGFGMTFSSCCASGVMTDLITDLPRAFITLIFFGLGVYLGFPLQSSQAWITDSLFTSSSYASGVFLPDLFTFDGLDGYLGSIILTAVFAGIVVYLSKKYEDKRRASGTYHGIDTEIDQEQVKLAQPTHTPFKLFSKATYEAMFVTPWSMKASATMIIVLFTLMLAVTQSGWGASTPFGIWIGQALTFIGVPIEQVAAFADRPVSMFALPFFEHPISVQNFGIVVGTLICVLLMGQLKFSFNYSAKQLSLFAMGGLLMGLGTRFANGCNVGALYTPIANLSLSGWIFFIFLVMGGVLGNKVAAKIS
ncbi:YeeE/YedE family protein [Vibrio aestuarianus]|uniref:YeeE/YedE family protein n=1 Tax=Vibrio aestuarianus TaxID=28171 RepID=UPI0006A62A6A|nr:YeeE/YedE family protein [Vibrio aestuarianus]KOE77792.1 membrane protein [Vibrio alginolyticus]MDE1221655.1 YeeE/YedE family protein [Vibrio aestuarianus]MDE1314195.1 YeeE/YedE family protein [Vibrio aestuarianus]MDE1325050.1 YeeE/YedE family protein [Vibrio aestuarianus]CAH8192754.1 Membrane protein [Vibrio aestuarianus]